MVIDMEMTGLNPEENSIVSAGLVMIENDRIKLSSAEHRFFKPTFLMADDVADSAHIHLITDQQRHIHGEDLEQFLTDLNGSLLVDAWIFHHAPIDLAFLKKFSKHLNIPLSVPKVIDTMSTERQLHKDLQLESHAQLSLLACRARYGLPVYRQHHALSDAIATGELYLAQKKYRPH